MVGASKILTVSYGTFSCTLEGFDEPFSTMKAIAEYFRDLAADDRYFGAEPPTPDAEMLHRIAEREIQRRVEAKISQNGIVLRQTPPADVQSDAVADEAAPVAARASHAPTPAVETVSALSVSGALAAERAPEPANDPAEQDVEVEVSMVGESDFAVASDDIAEPDEPAPFMAEADEGTDAGPADQPARIEGESVAAKLMRIRAAVAASRADSPAAAPVVQGYDDDAESEVDLAEAVQDHAPDADFGFAIDLPDLHRAAAPTESGKDIRDADDDMPEEVLLDLEAIDTDAIDLAALDAGDHATDVAEVDEVLIAQLTAGDTAANAGTDTFGVATADADDQDDMMVAAPVDDSLTESADAAVEAAFATGTAEASDDSDVDVDQPLDLAEDDVEHEAEVSETAEPLEAIDDMWAEADPDAEAVAADQDSADESMIGDMTAEPPESLSGDSVPATTDEDLAPEPLAEAEMAAVAALLDEEDDRARAPYLLGPDMVAEDSAPEIDTESTVEAVSDDSYDAAWLSDLDADTAVEPPEDQTAEYTDTAMADTLAGMTAEEDGAIADVADMAPQEPDAAAYDEDDAATAQVVALPVPDATPEKAGFLSRARARVIKVRKAVLSENDDEVEDPTEARKASGDVVFEDDLVAALREDALDEASDQDDDDAQDDGFGRPRLPMTEDEASVSRLMDEAANKLEGAENRRKFSAISHLKAAVAATVADRKLKPKDAPAEPAFESEDDIGRYREDLSKAVRPRRPAGETAGTTRRPMMDSRPAPLVLVSEQRVDDPDDMQMDATVIRPRRISSGNLALTEDDDILDAEAERPLTAEEAQNFADFAERLGASSLPDLLEAAAAYASSIEGRPLFSRPQILKKVAYVADEGDYTREDGLRSFGMLLRQGKIHKVRRGQFALADSSRFKEEARRVSN